MHPFGGSPRCARCTKAVYAAEQIMGPGRKLYHKSCLTCTSCGKRLDSYNLVEHQEEPYCKLCHVRLFGTRDLRHGNLPHRDDELKRGSPRSNSISSGIGNASAPHLPLPRHTTGAPVPPVPRISTASPPPLLKANRALSPTKASFYNNPRGNMSEGILAPPAEEGADDIDGIEDMLASLDSPSLARGISRAPGYGNGNGVHASDGARSVAPQSTGMSTMSRVSTMSEPPLRAATTGVRAGAALAPSMTGGNPARWGAAGNATCPRCAKTVYFAEQVKAVGKTWHRGCLRCTACATGLTPGRLADREGEPYCHRCYGKLHGPAGGGYALLGKAGG